MRISPELLATPALFAHTASSRSREAFDLARHLCLIDDALLDAAAGGQRIAITMPPRHGKSYLVSRAYPAWYLGSFPQRRVILASYEADFASSWGGKARDLLEQHAASFGVRVRSDSSARNRWDLDQHSGGMTTAGVGGPLTGRGADLLIIDDPIKNADEAYSQTIRDRLWDWYRSTAFTRLEPGGSVIVIQTRWHEDDLVGRLLREEGDRWRLLNLPAIAEEDDLLGRRPGEALWPERYDEADLAEKRETTGSYWWAALYQQRPAPAEGGMFQRSWMQQRWRALPADWQEAIQSWDMAFTDTKSSSYVVGQVWLRQGARCYLVDQVRAHMSFTETVQAVKDLSVAYPQATAKLVEDKANGPAVISSLRDVVPGIVPVTPRGGKPARAAAITPLFEAGNVWLPADAPWTGEYVEELCRFPNAQHDDQVDATSQALDRLRVSALSVVGFSM